MKNKIITIILGLLLVVSAVINVWQYNNNNSLKVQTELLQNELDSIEENINSLNMDISAKNEEIRVEVDGKQYHKHRNYHLCCG